jgi:5'-nucleotidase
MNKILLTNDDGILSPGLPALAEKLSVISPVVAVVPDREQSAIGTALTLHQLLRARRARQIYPEVETYAIDGTPGDSVILAVENLFKNEIGLVVSGINHGMNLGDDVLISGTVGAALQGYLRELPAIAVSADSLDSDLLQKTARLTALLAKRILDGSLPQDVLLNVNLPDTPLSGEVVITRLAHRIHIDSVDEGHDWKGAHYRLVRQRAEQENGADDRETDLWAVTHGKISITPLHAYLEVKPSTACLDGLCQELEREMAGAK